MVIEFVESIFRGIKDVFVIASFTTTAIDNMPMWAHYSNNHQGFCIKYEVLNSNMIFHISYEENRTAIANIITNYIAIVDKLSRGEIAEDDSEYKKYVHTMLSNSFIKHKSWKCEDEYRFVFMNHHHLPKGVSYSLDLLGLKVKNIYWKKLFLHNCQRLIDISLENCLEVFDIILEQQSNLYQLKSKKINISP